MKLLRSYIFWTYERGSFHYDVMVTLILIFLFVSPHYIDFRDKPVTNVPLRASEVLVRPVSLAGQESRLLYEIRVDDTHGAQTPGQIEAAILNAVEPISGDVRIESYVPVLDTKGNVVAYDATIVR